MTYRLSYFDENTLVWKPYQDCPTWREASSLVQAWSHDGFVMRVEWLSSPQTEVEEPSSEGDWIHIGDALNRALGGSLDALSPPNSV